MHKSSDPSKGNGTWFEMEQSSSLETSRVSGKVRNYCTYNSSSETFADRAVCDTVYMIILKIKLDNIHLPAHLIQHQ